MLAHLSSLIINPVATLSKVVLLLDVWEDTAANAHHPQELIDVITGVTASPSILNQLLSSLVVQNITIELPSHVLVNTLTEPWV